MFRATALLALAHLLPQTATAGAQVDRIAMMPARAAEVETTEPDALARGRYAVLIDLDENRLYFKQGDTTIWSAPVGTGTGMRLITDGDDWDFSTPNGRFQVEFKERDPVWIAPDWYFLENDLPVPPTNHPSRYMEGTLGSAAIYISPTLAIHGTNRPELIGQRVSHGCIRLENRYALRLFHNVQVGTEVIIVGGDEVRETARVVDLREGYDPSLASRGGRPEISEDPLLERWRAMDTVELLTAVEDELSRPLRQARWDEAAILLLDRAIEGDRRAMTGLLSLGASLPAATIEREWATFLAEMYRASPQRTLEAMTRLGDRQRRAAADLIVYASLTLFHGELDAPGAPWPTARVPREILPSRASAGWDALAAAERAHRDRNPAGTVQRI